MDEEETIIKASSIDKRIPYRPSCGDEGDWFERTFCNDCKIMDNEIKNDVYCPVLTELALGYSKHIYRIDDNIHCDLYEK
jgi:hypothetical protein